MMVVREKSGKNPPNMACRPRGLGFNNNIFLDYYKRTSLLSFRPRMIFWRTATQPWKQQLEGGKDDKLIEFWRHSPGDSSGMGQRQKLD
jgi:hypothetical protein